MQQLQQQQQQFGQANGGALKGKRAHGELSWWWIKFGVEVETVFHMN